MSDDIAIKVENLSKRYVISHQRAGGDGLRHVLQEKLTAPFRWLGGKIRGQKSEVGSGRLEARSQKSEVSSPTSDHRPPTSDLRPPTSEEFFALREVSFEINRGEVVGIIGRNGAGKSTLLKILSRITEPTSGRITIEGRVASLLEVGTGFHPELTGRENIFLNGAILGMSRVEIKSKFDEIVAFAEIERFLDTPVKRYSSGMYVRLAFAVAAHLEPEILVVDEVLAVGDAQFQEKCLGKMKDVSKGGRTVLFVSHNMAAIRHLCPTSILLEKGKMIGRDKSEKAIERYLGGEAGARGTQDGWIYRNRGRRIKVTKLELLVDGEPSGVVQSGQPCILRVTYVRVGPVPARIPLSVSFTLHTPELQLCNLWTNYFPQTSSGVNDAGHVDCEIARWPFREATVRVDVYIHFDTDVEDWIENCMAFTSHLGDYYRTGRTVPQSDAICFLEHRWTFHALADAGGAAGKTETISIR